MPVLKCPNKEYRIGKGQCMYKSRASADRAYKGYLGKKYGGESKFMEKMNEALEGLIGSLDEEMARGSEGYFDDLVNRDFYDETLYNMKFNRDFNAETLLKISLKQAAKDGVRLMDKDDFDYEKYFENLYQAYEL